MKALVVDGYNAIYKIPYLKKAMNGSLRDARRGITELAKEYQRRCGGIGRVYVVFDGKNLYIDKPFETPPNQIFSKTGEGDREIVRLVSRLSREYHVVVVTDDNFIRNNCRAYKASIVGLSEFVTFLNKRWRRSSVTEEEPVDKVTPESASDINEELRKEWNI